jgi:hypothetical protein
VDIHPNWRTSFINWTGSVFTVSAARRSASSCSAVPSGLTASVWVDAVGATGSGAGSLTLAAAEGASFTAAVLAVSLVSISDSVDFGSAVSVASGTLISVASGTLISVASG